MAQARASADPQLKLRFAREVVAARLHNMATIAVRFDWKDAPATAAELRELLRTCLDAPDLDTVRGLEGRGAATSFLALGESLDPRWGFDGRHKNPPTDPVNAMLSLGYTVLHHHVSTGLAAAGLNPRIGLYHREHGAHHALASDMQEEFRHLVEAHAWSMIRRREVELADFVRPDKGPGACWMTHDFRRTFLESLERRLGTAFTPAAAAEPVTYLEFLDAQARALREWILGRAETYRALRSHA